VVYQGDREEGSVAVLSLPSPWKDCEGCEDKEGCPIHASGAIGCMGPTSAVVVLGPPIKIPVPRDSRWPVFASSSWLREIRRRTKRRPYCGKCGTFVLWNDWLNYVWCPVCNVAMPESRIEFKSSKETT